MSTTDSPAAASPAKPSETYTGSCHCGRFKYTVTQSPPLSDPESSVIECNCSICARNGYLLIYVPDSSVAFQNGDFEGLSKYTFAPNHKIAHYFCPSCGTSCFAKSTHAGYYADYKAVNVRTFSDIDLKSLKLNVVDGKNR